MVMDFMTEHRATCRVTVKTQIECWFLEHKYIIVGSNTALQGGIVGTRTLFYGNLNTRNFLPIVDYYRN